MRIALVILIALSILGCNPMITKQEFAPEMYKTRPASILVLPPINKSTAADAKEYYVATIAEPLTNCGYYVFPTEVVNEVLKQEGLFDTETMMSVPLEKFKEYFGADAVLFVTILEWNTQYLITAGSVTVKIACDLKSTVTGETIWFYDDVVTINTSGDSGGAGGWAGLLIAAVSTAVKTAAQDYVPVARQVNEKIMLAMPFGKLHPNFQKDGKVSIEKKKKIDGATKK
jgi:hypothetical protein